MEATQPRNNCPHFHLSLETLKFVRGKLQEPEIHSRKRAAYVADMYRMLIMKRFFVRKLIDDWNPGEGNFA